MLAAHCTFFRGVFAPLFPPPLPPFVPVEEVEIPPARRSGALVCAGAVSSGGFGFGVEAETEAVWGEWEWEWRERGEWGEEDVDGVCDARPCSPEFGFEFEPEPDPDPPDPEGAAESCTGVDIVRSPYF